MKKDYKKVLGKGLKNYWLSITEEEKKAILSARGKRAWEKLSPEEKKNKIKKMNEKRHGVEVIKKNNY